MRDAPPSWEQIGTLIATAAAKNAPPAPAPEKESATAKWVLGIVASLLVLFLGGLGNYAGSMVAGVGSVGTKIDQLKTSFDDLKKTVDQVTVQSQAQQVTLGRQDLRLTNLEQGQARVLERVRQLEGRAPVTIAPALAPAGAP